MIRLLLAVMQLQGSAMTIPYEVVAQDPEAAIEQVFQETDARFNDWNPESEISRLNQLPAGERLEISPQLATFLERVGELVKLTEGRFDPTLLALQEALQRGESPPPEAIGWERIHLEGRTFWKEDGRSGFLLGGVAKGYTVDQILGQLEVGAYVNWGGEIATSGAHPEGRPWRIAVQTPGSQEPYTVLELQDAAVATSGDYLQEGHIYNPLTLNRLQSDVVSATVVAESAMEADALATALMVAGSQEEVERLLQRLEELRPNVRALVLFTQKP